MTNKQLQELLSKHPDDMPVKIMIDHEDRFVKDMDAENILHTSETAHADSTALEDEWDSEDGKITLGSGKQFLLINPIII